MVMVVGLQDVLRRIQYIIYFLSSTFVCRVNMDNEDESSDTSGDANLVNSGSLLEEEKVEVAAPEAGVSDGVGPVKTSEDDNDLNAPDVYHTQQTDAAVADGAVETESLLIKACHQGITCLID